MIIHTMKQRTPEWYALRSGMPTGSEFSKLVTGTGLPSDSLPDYAMDLATQKLAGEDYAEGQFGGNKHTERGNELEDFAIAAYEFDYDCTVEKVGFVTDDLLQWGVSPDGFVGAKGMAEVKCLTRKEHGLVLKYYREHKKAKPQYKPQTQGQMMVCERDWVDLIFYHPKLPMLVIRQEPDLKFVHVLKNRLLAVIAERNLMIKLIEGF